MSDEIERIVAGMSPEQEAEIFARHDERVARDEREREQIAQDWNGASEVDRWAYFRVYRDVEVAARQMSQDRRQSNGRIISPPWSARRLSESVSMGVRP